MKIEMFNFQVFGLEFMDTKVSIIGVFVLALVLCGCAAFDNDVRVSSGVSSTEDVLSDGVSGKPQAVRSLGEAVEPNGTVTLQSALAFALINNPQLRAFSWEIRAAEARRIQAALLPNPEIGIEIEQFGGTGDRRSFNSSETTVQLGQLIELAEKRTKRIRLADVEKDLSLWDYRSKRLDVMNEVTRAFIEVLAAQERLALKEELVRLSEKARQAVAQKVQAGKDSPVDETKAMVAASAVRIELEQAKQVLASARQKLVARWGGSGRTFDRAAGKFYDVLPAPSFERKSVV